MKRTDMAVEFAPNPSTRQISEQIKRIDITVDKALSQKLKKSEGNYITIESRVVIDGKKHYVLPLVEAISEALRELIADIDCECMVVGLGNPNMTADALGKKVCEDLMITRHLYSTNELPRISSICPNVLGVTGIESFDIVKSVVEKTKPDCVIVVDSLAGAATTRIATAFQLSNVGITPGSGVSNHRKRLDEKSLGVKVISVGVPLVVYASTIIQDALNNENAEFDQDIGSLIVTPKDIDIYVEDCASIIARSINMTFFGDDFCF